MTAGRALSWLAARAGAGVDRFFADADMRPIVACRIAFGLLLFAAYADRARWIGVLYGPDGVGGPDLAARLPEAAFGRPIDAPFHFILTAADSLSLVWFAWGLLLVASLSFALGYRTRLSGAVALVLHSAFLARNQYAYYGWAWMAKPYVLYVILAPSGSWVSIDAWRRGVRPSTWLAPGWPLRLLKLHVCTMYAVAGLSRLEDSSWRRGEMLFAAVTDRGGARFDFDWHAVASLLEPLSYVAFVAEPLAPILLWVPGLGTVWALLLMSLHAGLELLVYDSWWQWLMLGALLAFLPPRWLGRPLAALDRVGRRVFSRAARAP